MTTPMKFILRTLCLLILLSPFFSHAEVEKRPNFMFILSEDNSMHFLRLYGDKAGATPNIEAMAKQGLVFDHAFSCAPVCSVARTTLMTGIYAPKLGTQYHRRSALATLPEGVEMWPAYLRESGYYTSNNSKKDYNVKEGKVWDESSKKATWRKRADKGQPFFHMETTTVSHESSLHFPASEMKKPTQTPQKDVWIAPYHPDTPTFRYTYTRYHDKIKAADSHVGKLIGQLKEDGVLEDTFIFYFGDHGGVLPRGKGYIYESGLHVPLVVRVPKNFAHLVDFEPGTRTGGFAEFVDFGPTLLHLAGLDIPKVLDGEPLFGEGVSAKNLEKRDTSFGYADRFDEKYDFCRSIRKGRFQYIRNYMSYLPDGLQNNYRYKMLAYQEWRNLFKQGKLNAEQSQFFLPRPAEQLFDVEADPHEVKDLSADPEYADVLKELRKELQDHLNDINDLSFYPESYMVDNALEDGIGYGKKYSGEIDELMEIADLSLLPFRKAKKELKEAITSDEPLERYWGFIACSNFGKQAGELASIARKSLDHENQMVRLRAAEFLGIIGALDPRPVLADIINTSKSDQEILWTLNTVVLFNDHHDLKFDPSSIQRTFDKRDENQRRIDYLTGKL